MVLEPIVFISRSRIKEGHVQALRELSAAATAQLEADKPGTVAFGGYVNDAGTEVFFAHVFPDAAAMDAHMEGVAERAVAALEHIETISFEVYGRPSDAVLAMLGQPPGVDLKVRSDGLGGYLRLGAG